MEGFNDVEFDDGGSYSGNWKNGVPSGYGKSIDPQGCIYEGEFQRGAPNGKGKLTFTDGECYKGEFQNGKKHGFGRLALANGDTYVGNFAVDMKHGYGTYTQARTGKGWSGEWRSNRQYKEGAKPPSKSDYNQIAYEGDSTITYGDDTVIPGVGQGVYGDADQYLDPSLAEGAYSAAPLNIKSPQNPPARPAKSTPSSDARPPVRPEKPERYKDGGYVDVLQSKSQEVMYGDGAGEDADGIYGEIRGQMPGEGQDMYDNNPKTRKGQASNSEPVYGDGGDYGTLPGRGYYLNKSK